MVLVKEALLCYSDKGIYMLIPLLYPGPRGFLLPWRDKRQRSRERKPLVADDSCLILPHQSESQDLPPDWRDINCLIVYSDWLLLTGRCFVIGCLLIDLVMLIDTYFSVIVICIASLPEVFSLHFFLSPRWKTTSGTRLPLLWIVGGCQHGHL